MKRRDFIKELGLSAAAAAFGPALLSEILPTQTGATVATDGWSAATDVNLSIGDIFTIDGYFAINPITGKNTGLRQQFVVTAVIDGEDGGAVNISPPIITHGAYRTVAGPYGFEPVMTRIAAHRAQPLFYGRTVPMDVEWVPTP